MMLKAPFRTTICPHSRLKSSALEPIRLDFVNGQTGEHGHFPRMGVSTVRTVIVQAIPAGRPAASIRRRPLQAPAGAAKQPANKTSGRLCQP